MMSPRVKEIIQIIINNIIHSERQLEKIKLEMSKQNLFSLQPIFLRLDQNRQGFIDSQDLISFFEDNDLHLAPQQAYYILRWMDRDCDGQLKFQEYPFLKILYYSLCHCLLPRDNYRQRVVTALREPYFIDSNMYLPIAVEKPLAFYFSQLANLVDLHQKLKAQLRVEQYNAYQTFAQISKNKAYISVEDLTNCFEISLEDLQYFFQVADLDADGQISQQEFLELTLNVDQKVASTSNSGTPERAFLKLSHQVNDHANDQTAQTQESNTPERQMDSPFRFSFQKKQDKSPEREGKDQTGFITPLKKDRIQDYHNYIQTINRQKEQQKNITTKSTKKTENKSEIVQKYYTYFKYLLKQILATREMEELRKQLSLRQDFNVLDAFRLIDHNYKGQVSVQELQNAFRQIRISQFDLNRLHFLMAKYAQNPDTMTFDEFHDMIVPFSEDFKTLVQNRAPSYSQQNTIEGIFSQQTIEIYKQLIETITQNLYHLSELRKQIRLKGDEIFELLDCGSKGFIEVHDFREFLQLFDVHPTNQELKRVQAMYTNEEQVTKADFKRELSL